jgi:hypothetical protein
MIYKFALAQSDTKEIKQVGHCIFYYYYYEKCGRERTGDGFTV